MYYYLTYIQQFRLCLSTGKQQHYSFRLESQLILQLLYSVHVLLYSIMESVDNTTNVYVLLYRFRESANIRKNYVLLYSIRGSADFTTTLHVDVLLYRITESADITTTVHVLLYRIREGADKHCTCTIVQDKGVS